MSNLVSQYRKDQKRLLDDVSTGTQMPPRVSIGDNKFTLIDPSGERTDVPFLPTGPALDVVFVDRNEHTSKLFWGEGKTYNPSETAPPICFSDNGVAPSSQAMEPQNPTCGSCRWNAIGSAISQISGARIRACGDMKKLAVVVRGFPGVYLFTIKPGSFKAWNNYTSYLRLQKLPDGGRPDLSDIVTRIRFTGQGILSFEAVELVEADLAKQVIDIWDKNQTNDITGMMVGRYDQPAQSMLTQGTLGVDANSGAKPAAEPPPQQGSHLFFKPPAQDAVAARPAAAPAEPKRAGRPAAKKKDEGPAPLMPAQPAAPHGIITKTPDKMPGDVQARLNNLFNLPPVK